MKSSIILPALAVFGLLRFPLCAQAPKEDDFLIFDKIEIDSAATPFLPSTPRKETPAGTPSKRPLPANKTAALNTILLDVPDKSFATGRVSSLTATASQVGTQDEPEIRFDGATKSLQMSLEKTVALLIAANPKFPDGVTLKVKPHGSYGGHEKDAAGVATAILLEALGTGKDLDPEAVLLGGVGEKGVVTKVSRLATRIRTLEGPPPPVIGVPRASEVEVRDLALMNELDVLAKYQIIAMDTLEDARVIAAKEKPEKVAKAFKIFSEITAAAATTPMKSLITNAGFIKRIQEINTLMPNHLSARLLLLAASGKLPGYITYATSRQAILKAMKPFVNVTSVKSSPKEVQAVATESGNVLLRLQPKIDPSVARYLLTMKAYLRAVNNFLDISPDAQHAVMRNRALVGIAKHLKDIQVEKEKLDKVEEAVD